jgi:hypothetical protein
MPGSEAEDGPKQLTKQQLRAQDDLAAQLLELCSAPKRDLAAINKAAQELKAQADRPSQSPELTKDWKLVFVTSDDILGAVGTGLHKLPLTRMEDTFMSLRGTRSSGRSIETIEVCVIKIQCIILHSYVFADMLCLAVSMCCNVAI